MVRRQLKDVHGARVVDGTSGNAKWAIEQAIATGYIARHDKVPKLANGTGVKLLASDGSKVVVYHSGKVSVGGPLELLPATVNRIRACTVDAMGPPLSRKRRKV